MGETNDNYFGVCGIVIYNKKYTLGLHPVPSTKLPRLLEFLKCSEHKSAVLSFVIHSELFSTTPVYVNEALLESP